MKHEHEFAPFELTYDLHPLFAGDFPSSRVVWYRGYACACGEQGYEVPA